MTDTNRVNLIADARRLYHHMLHGGKWNPEIDTERLSKYISSMEKDDNELEELDQLRFNLANREHQLHRETQRHKGTKVEVRSLVVMLGQLRSRFAVANERIEKLGVEPATHLLPIPPAPEEGE